MKLDTQSTLEPVALVRQHTMERIEHFLVGPHLDVYQGLRSVSTQVSESYRSRVVVELVQNAHDAHPQLQGMANGRIAIALDESEGRHGHLYVANAGFGFSPDNFTKLCGVATSTKRINEGIGYKGIGFLSVFQVCAHPEIYSINGRAAVRDDFDGFRFCIPDDAQLRRELATLGVAQHAAAIAHDMPRILLPVPIEGTPDQCRAFAKEGYATVVRLPLKNDEARVAVYDQIVDLSGTHMPLHLFLDRLAEISVSIRGGGDGLERRLRRVPRAIFRRGGLDISEIETSDEITFLVVAMTLPRAEFIGVIEADVQAERIASDWADWQGDAEIAVAVSVDGSSIEGRFYNFLPMSDEARSSFPGHLNAPFHTSIDRRSLTENVRLNDFLLDQSADLCVRAVEVLRDRGYRHAVYAVPDLLCWRGQYRRRMRHQLVTRDIELANCRFAPVLGSKGRGVVWRTFGEARVWQDECELLSPARIAREAGATVLTPMLGDERIKRLEEFCAPDVDLRPDPNNVVKWVEGVAHKLQERHKNRPRYSEWNSFYRALERLFCDTPEVLFGRRLMLTANDRLVPAERPEERPRQRRKKDTRSALFFPPVRGAERRLKKQLPAAVQRRINFLHPNLECSRERSEHAEVRRFLEHNQLVRRNDAREFLRVLAGAMADPGRIQDVDSFRWSALQVALDMVEPVDVGSWLGEMHVPVPTRGGWIPADRAYLGSEWPKTRGRHCSPGRDLEDLIVRARNESREIASLEDALIVPLLDWRLETRDYHRCRQFLVACGAMDHLRPMRVGRGRPPKVNGGELAGALTRWSGLNEQSRHVWRQDLAPAGRALPNPYTLYSAEVPWRLPGQDDYREFSNDVRTLYARQVINLLNTFEGAVTKFHVHRPDYSRAPNRAAWLTPLACFLIHEAWVPVAQADGSTTFVTASDAWVYERDTARRPPEFLDFAASEFLDSLDDCVEASAILKNHFHLKSLNAKSSAIPLVHLLGTVAAEGRVHQDEVGAFGKLYERAWKNAFDAVDAGADPPKPSHLAAVEAGRLVALPTSSDAHDLIKSGHDDVEGPSKGIAPVWLDDASSPLTGHMLAEAGIPVFPFRLEKGEKVTGWLAELFPSLVKRASQADVSIHVDDEQFTPSPESPTLVDVLGHWLPEFVAVAADLGAPFARLKPEELAVKVRQLRLRRADTISVRIGDDIAPLPEFACGCLFCNDAEIPTIIYEERMDEHGFDLLSRLSNALDEALSGRSQLGMALSAGGLQLARLYDEASAPSDDDYAMIFNQPVTRVRSVLDLVRGEMDLVLFWLCPLVWMTAGRDAVGEFEKAAASARTEEDIHVALGTLKCPPSLSADELIAACKAAITGADLVRQLGLDLAHYNKAAVDLGSKYELLDFSTEHADTFRRFMADQQRQVRESLRVHFLHSFDAGGDLSNYVAIRDDAPSPDPAWGTTYLDLPEQTMKDRLAKHLADADVTLIGEKEWLDPPFAEVRELNRVALRDIAERAVSIVQAWCHKESQPVPSLPTSLRHRPPLELL